MAKQSSTYTPAAGDAEAADAAPDVTPKPYGNRPIDRNTKGGR